MSKQPGSHNTPRAVVEEILRLHNEADFLGSDVVLTSLLGRKPHTLAEYLEREG